MTDYTANENAACIAAQQDAYPEAAPIERYELHDEDEANRALLDADPHEWPEGSRPPLLAAFDRAVTKAREEWTAEQHKRVLDVLDDVLCDVCRRNEAEANGLCRECMEELRDERWED